MAAQLCAFIEQFQVVITETLDATDVLGPLDDDRDSEVNCDSKRPRPKDGATVPRPLSKLLLVVSACDPPDDEAVAIDECVDTVDNWSFCCSCSILMRAPRPRPSGAPPSAPNESLIIAGR